MKNKSDLVRASLAVAALLACGAAAAAPLYHLVEVGQRSDQVDYVGGMNSHEQIATTLNAYPQRATLSERGGRSINLGTLGGTESMAAAVNANKMVVGAADTADGTLHAFAWKKGQMTDLGAFVQPHGQTFSSASAVNSMGHVVGSSRAGAKGAFHAFLYEHGDLKDLGTFPGGYSSEAYGINDAGDIVGQATVATTFANHAFLYTHGAMQDLGTLQAGGSSIAWGVNNPGQVVGISYDANGNETAVAWVDGVIKSLAVPPPAANMLQSEAYAVNDAGTTVGQFSTQDSDSAFSDHAFVHDGTQMSDLGTLLDAPSAAAGWHITAASGIDANGVIAATATASDGTLHAVLLTPVN